MTREWYFQAMGQELGPLSVGELKAKVANGQIQPDTLVRKTAEGKWVFASKVKGLFAIPDEPPPPPPVAAKPKSSATMPTVSFIESRAKSGSSAEMPVKSGGSSVSIPVAKSSTATGSSPPAKFVPLATMKLVDDEEEDTASKPPSVEFYHFVGFREAISPVLYDAVEQFVAQRGITMTQLNRRALAEFIQKPELASDLMITAVAVIPQPVGAKSNADGSQPLTEKQQIELATFRFTLFNSGRTSIHVEQGTFLAESIESRDYDTIDEGQHPPLDHAGHRAVDVSGIVEGRAVRIELDVTVPPQETRDVTLWFHSADKPAFQRLRGQLLVGHGGELAMSEFFTVLIHGDSPAAGC